MDAVSKKCFQIIGPPGTGKTTYLVRQAEIAGDKVGFAKLMIASLTKAAAHEFSSRGLQGIPRDQLGTLHSICLRALGRPELVEKHLDDWKEFLRQNQGPHAYEITTVEGGAAGYDQGSAAKTLGDELHKELTILRNQQPGVFYSDTPPTLSHRLREFERLWTAWKRERELVDFTDLLEQCTQHVERAPGSPRVLFGDEVQDWSRLEVELYRDHWGKHADKIVLVGDEDQAIYDWRGADPRIFLDHHVPNENRIVLTQSYRVPLHIRDYALELIRRAIPDRNDVEYQPRDERGLVGSLDCDYKNPYRIPRVLDACREKGQTVMILASCGYMLRPTLKFLREAGVPFANPYRLRDRAWNPLRSGRGKPKPENTRLDRTLDFLAGSPGLRGPAAREWTWGEVRLWAAPLRASGKDAVLRHGAKTKIDHYARSRRGLVGEFPELFDDLWVGGPEGENARGAWRMDMSWWISAMKENEASHYRYFQTILEKHGPRALVEPPRVMIGTIHSVKGGEADVVILFPDVSKAAYQAKGYRQTLGRLFYVGATRARHTLVVCAGASPLRADLPPRLAPFEGRLMGLRFPNARFSDDPSTSPAPVV